MGRGLKERLALKFLCSVEQRRAAWGVDETPGYSVVPPRRREGHGVLLPRGDLFFSRQRRSSSTAFPQAWTL